MPSKTSFSIPPVTHPTIVAVKPGISATTKALIIGISTKGEGSTDLKVWGAAGVLPPKAIAAVTKYLSAVGADPKAEVVTRIPAPTALDISAESILAVGLGPVAARKAPTAETIRRASGAAARAASALGRVTLTLTQVAAEAAIEGYLLGGYSFDAFRSEAAGTGGVTGAGTEAKPPHTVEVVVDQPRAAATKHLIEGREIAARAVARARNLVNTPPNVLYPESFAQWISDTAEAAGRSALSVEILDPDQLREGGYGGILAVGTGSSRGPRLVRLSYAPAGAKKHIALVGKGITFDTGGISLKPGAGMEQMTMDMGGAAAVIATTFAAAEAELPVRVTATVPLAENMPSGTAYRPGDVIRHYGGTTVEILNTDAEGRIVLADALVRAAEDDPDALIDTATLTGAQMVALGKLTSGIMGTDELRDYLAELGRAVGEDSWAMPLPPHLTEEMSSRVADLANAGPTRWGGMLFAGEFLRHFVPATLPWAHIDIAGPAFNDGSPRGYSPKGGTGVPVRTLLAFLEAVGAGDWEANPVSSE